MGATVRASWFGANASEPAGSTAETGIVYNLEDSKAGTTTPITVPAATGTNYSWIKQLALEVTAVAVTAITNRNFRVATAPATGLHVYFKNNATYAQPASGNKPADVGTSGTVPATYTEANTTFALWDNASVSANATGRNGNFVQVAAGVDNTFTGGAGSATALPNAELRYDEA